MLSTDEVQDQVSHPDLPDEEEFNIVLDRIGTETALKLARGPLLVDAGLAQGRVVMTL
jgi:hypothetical protein